MRRRATRRAGALAAVLAAVVALTAGCGGGRPAAATSASTTVIPPGGARLTQDQALELSSALYRDYTAGGSSVVVNVPYSASTTVGIVGNVDFQHHEGHLTVTTVVLGSGTSVENVDYTAAEVFEQGGPVVAAELARAGRAGQSWVGRPPDPTDRPVDKVIEILVSLASPTRDNPLLVQESPATFLGRTTLDGTAVDAFKYNLAITYYIGVTDGLIHRFVGNVSGFSGPITVDVSSPGPRSLPPPSAAQVLTVSASPSPSPSSAPSSRSSSGGAAGS